MKVKEQELRKGLSLLQESDYRDLNVYGRPKTVTKTEEIERSGLLGGLVDKLIGSKTVTKTETEFEGGLSGREVKYIRIIKEAENEFKMKKQRNLNNTSSRGI